MGHTGMTLSIMAMIRLARSFRLSPETAAVSMGHHARPRRRIAHFVFVDLISPPMKYYENCKLTVNVPSRGFDEATVRDALIDALPGIEIEFRRVGSSELLEAVEAFVPHDHPVAGADERDPDTKKWTSVGARTVLLTAGDILNEIIVRNG
jgi:hypothetical protein